MPHVRSRFILYASFIGIPLLCLSGVLLIGRRLLSPVSVGGEWNIDPGAMQGDCAAVPPDGKPPSLRITQMGSNVTVRLGGDKSELRGEIDGNVIAVTPTRRLGTARCPARSA